MQFNTGSPEAAGGGHGSCCRPRYDALVLRREPYLRRARDVSKLTVPWMVMEEGANGSSDLATPFQSTGARGVNNLASALLLSLFPPNQSFFRYRVEPYAAETAGAIEGAQEEIEVALTKAESAVMAEIEASGFRPRAHEAFRHLLVAGNALLYWPKDQAQMRVYHLDEYVVERDAFGGVVEIVTVDFIHRDAPPERLKPLVNQIESGGMAPGAPTPDKTAALKLFTHVKRDGKRYKTHQSLEGLEVPDSSSVVDEAELPYVALRGNVVSGEPYARSHGEDYLGDLQSLEGLVQAIVEGSAAAARVLFMVNPAGTTDIEDMTGKPNGGFAAGNAADVTVLQLNKYADFRVAAETADKIDTRLQMAFLLNTSVQRQAERVTAQEIRWVAQDLERGLGGMYSLLSQEFQLPIVRLVQARLTSANKMPKIAPNVAKPSIVAGLEALGRGNDADRINAALATITQHLTPAIASQYINPEVLIARTLVAWGVKDDGLVKSNEEVEQGNANAQMRQLVEKLGPEAMRQLGAQAQGGAQQPQ